MTYLSVEDANMIVTALHDKAADFVRLSRHRENAGDHNKSYRQQLRDNAEKARVLAMRIYRERVGT